MMFRQVQTLSTPLLAILIVSLFGCSTATKVATLRSLDVSSGEIAESEVVVKPKTEEEIKAAYYEYVNSGSSAEKSRLRAINRLAEMEIEGLNEMLRDRSGPVEDGLTEDILYRESLQRTLNLLLSSLEEFPDAASNDANLYQLARTYDQLGDPDNSLAALRKLTLRYPKSEHYSEAQFRLGEAAFAAGDYISAEDAYSEALFSDSSNTFFERALFKRGWSRYKQGLYTQAADDYLAALKHQQFADYYQLEGSEKDEADEYFRSIGLAFSGLQDFQTLQSFFAGESDTRHLYHIYRVISETYLEQERYSDAAGVMNRFIEMNPGSSDIPLAELQIINAWQAGGFKALFAEALESFYLHYRPDHTRWGNQPESVKKMVSDALRKYAMKLASYHHQRYKQTRRSQEFDLANMWYTRYLEHYVAYARQDEVFNNYAELLADRGNEIEALRYFELAAYDGDIVLDKDAAYTTIVLASTLNAEQPGSDWLDKQLRYALISARLYSAEAKYQTAALHAAETAFNSKRYDEAIVLADTLPDNAANELLYKASVLKGLSYREAGDPASAEAVFSDLLTRNLSSAERRMQTDNLALAIYQQAEAAVRAEEVDLAIEHFARVARLTPDSDIAPIALYEALVQAMNRQRWEHAISYAEHFELQYADHKLARDASRLASTAYLNAGDKANAARAFEQLATEDSDREVKMAALWQAAELYESRSDLEAAIRSYRSYAHTYLQPYPQNVEAMYKLTQLYASSGETEKRRFWQMKIAEADEKTAKSQKTPRTNRLAATALLDLGKQSAEAFRRQQLVAPLAENLRAKKQLLQESTTFYGRASAYGFADITTEATYSIGHLYAEFSRALLDSERPPELRGEELEQYNILLEDQAFPFEDKAIEFHEMNLARIKEGVSDDWIMESYRQLISLFPVRYDKKGKVEIYHE